MCGIPGYWETEGRKNKTNFPCTTLGYANEKQPTPKTSCHWEQYPRSSQAVLPVNTDGTRFWVQGVPFFLLSGSDDEITIDGDLQHFKQAFYTPYSCEPNNHIILYLYSLQCNANCSIRTKKIFGLLYQVPGHLSVSHPRPHRRQLGTHRVDRPKRSSKVQASVSEMGFRHTMPKPLHKSTHGNY
jgi:hypothetical protein